MHVESACMVESVYLTTWSLDEAPYRHRHPLFKNIEELFNQLILANANHQGANLPADIHQALMEGKNARKCVLQLQIQALP